MDAHGDAGPDAAHEAGAFHGDCKSAQWATVSAACWSCFCGKCETSLDQCGPDCLTGVQCAATKHVLVGVQADLPCEIRAFTAECGADPAVIRATNVLYSFDSCLISSHDPAKDMLRACETECGTTYTGDVCQRFPAPDAG